MEEFFNNLVSNWWGILIIVVVALILWIALSALLYRQFFKRFYDLVLSGIGILVLSPILLLLIVIGAIKMKGNPFFTQLRPGKRKRNGEEKIFKLIKFRTMTNEKDENGNLLPDEVRLNSYGKFLRKTSLDELPELINIFIGNMTIIGPRPLLVKYLPLYSAEQRRRHDVRPGLTGFAQVHGRNKVSWSEKFEMDVWYVDNLSLMLDIKLIFSTVKVVLKSEGISSETSVTMEEFKGNEKTDEEK